MCKNKKNLLNENTSNKYVVYDSIFVKLKNRQSLNMAEEITTMGQWKEELWGLMGMFYILFSLVVTHMYTFPKTH